MGQQISKFFKSFVIWFAVFYLGMTVYQKFIKPQPEVVAPEKTAISLTAAKSKLAIGNLVSFKIQNNGMETLSFRSPCAEGGSALSLSRVVNEKNVLISDFAGCKKDSIPSFEVPAGAEKTFSLPVQNSLFDEPGKYVLGMTFDQAGESLEVTSTRVEMTTPGTMRELFRAVISKPIFNLMVFFSQNLPGKPLGWAVILITIIVRIALFIPNQKAMKSQRAMQTLQPKIAEIKEKYKDNQQELAKKTMELYKTYQVSPMSSCLPMLIQFPIMIGLYYIVSDGLSPHLSHLLYTFQSGVNIQDVNNVFLGMDLTLVPSKYVSIEYWDLLLLPLLVGIAQWIAVRLSLVSAKKRKKKEDVPMKKKDEKTVGGMEGQMESMNKMMQWVMPAMITFFAFSFPAAVGIYWLTSTLFGIGQQKFVNWQLDQPKVRRKS
jgi:YidC/Oxa1 family membrane protein insertase